MQFMLCTGWSSFLKFNAIRVKFFKPGFASNVFDIANERAPGLHKRDFISLIIATKPSMLKKSIAIDILLSAKVLRAGMKAM